MATAKQLYLLALTTYAAVWSSGDRILIPAKDAPMSNAIALFNNVALFAYSAMIPLALYAMWTDVRTRLLNVHLLVSLASAWLSDLLVSIALDEMEPAVLVIGAEKTLTTVPASLRVVTIGPIVLFGFVILPVYFALEFLRTNAACRIVTTVVETA